MTNLNDTAAALLKLKEEMKTCPRNKSGSLNGTARGARVKRCAEALQAAGNDRHDAWAMAHQAAK